MWSLEYIKYINSNITPTYLNDSPPIESAMIHKEVNNLEEHCKGFQGLCHPPLYIQNKAFNYIGHDTLWLRKFIQDQNLSKKVLFIKELKVILI
jgi:hypothetical protein